MVATERRLELEFRGGTWRVVGPAAGEAVVRFARPNARLKATAGPAAPDRGMPGDRPNWRTGNGGDGG
jgi:hypothetical protein